MLLNNKCYILSACPSWQRTYHLENTAQIYFTPTNFRIMLTIDKKSKLFRISIRFFLNKNENLSSKLNTVKCYILLEIQQPVHLGKEHTIWKTVPRYISLTQSSEVC